MDVYGSNKNHLFNPKNANHLRSPVTRADTHTHTFWPVVIDMFKKNQKSQENESRAIKKTNMFTLKRVTVSSCSWVRQLYPVFAPLHSSCKGGTCYHGQKVWVRASAIQELPVSFHHNTWGISSSCKYFYTVYLSIYLSIYIYIYVYLYIGILVYIIYIYIQLSYISYIYI